MQDESDSPEQAFESFRGALRELCAKDGDFGVEAALLAFDECLELAESLGRQSGPPVYDNDYYIVALPGTYRHYRGGLYTLLFVARHHDSGQPMAIYVSHDHHSVNVRPIFGYPGDPDGWATPLSDGTKRFQRVED